jgi:hypothetical protein
MPKALCVVSLVVSALVLVLFLLNLVASFPFGGAGGMIGNGGMILGAGIIGAFSVLTFREYP